MSFLKYVIILQAREPAQREGEDLLVKAYALKLFGSAYRFALTVLVLISPRSLIRQILH